MLSIRADLRMPSAAEGVNCSCEYEVVEVSICLGGKRGGKARRLIVMMRRAVGGSRRARVRGVRGALLAACCLAVSLAGCSISRAGGGSATGAGVSATTGASGSASSAGAVPYVSATGMSSAALANDGVALVLSNVDGRQPGSDAGVSYTRDSWSRNVPEGANGSGALVPVVTGDAVYAAAGSAVLKLDPATGEELARASLDGQASSSSFASFDEGLVLVPLASGALAAFDENLAPQWQSAPLDTFVAERNLGTGAWHGSHALVSGDSVYVAMSYFGQDSTGVLLCLSSADGSLRWRADLDAGLVDMMRVSDIAATDDGILVPAGEKLALYAYADGAQLDTADMGAPISGCLAPLLERTAGPDAYAFITQAGALMTLAVSDGAIDLTRHAEPAGGQPSGGARLTNATPRAWGDLIAVASFSHAGLSSNGSTGADLATYLVDASTLQTVDVLEGAAPQGSALVVQGMGGPDRYLIFFNDDRLVRVPVEDRAFGEPETLAGVVPLRGGLSRQELALTADGLVLWAEPSSVKAAPALE